MILLGLFFSERYFAVDVLTFSTKQLGAPVSMFMGTTSHQASIPAAPAAVAPSQKAAAIPEVKVSEAPKPEKKVEKAAVKQDAPKKEIKPKAAPAIEKIPKSGKPEEKKKQAIKKEPVYSELKKEYTTLKKEKEKPEKVEEKKQEKSGAESKIIDVKPAPSTAAQPHSGSTNAQSSAAAVEKIEFDAEVAAWSNNDSVREFGRHFTLPPGFEEHDPLTVTFEVHEGKVVSMSPRGSEPLVIYAAIKDALFRMKWPVTKHIKKIQFIIK